MATPRIARACLLAMTLASPALALGASVPYSFACDATSGVSSNPNDHKRVGYITVFQGMGLAPSSLRPDLKVIPPYLVPPASGGKLPSTGNTAQVVGVIEKFEWSGGLGDPIQVDFYVSQQNAVQIKAAVQQTLTTTKVDRLGWWIVDYDPVAGKWYEQAYPLGPGSPGAISGIIANKGNPQLTVDLTPANVNKVALYKVTLKVAPAANLQYPLSFANSSTKRVTQVWGLAMGSMSTVH